MPSQNVARNRRSSLSPSEVIPKRRDSSIGATSANPRLRRQSVLEVAAAMHARSTTNFNTLESVNAMRKLQKLFLPIVQKYIYKKRRQRKWKVFPPHLYSTHSSLSCITTSKSLIADWPSELLLVLVTEVEYRYYLANEIAVYKNETHLSTGVVLLLRGTLVEDRAARRESTNERQVHTQTSRQRYAPDVLCDSTVLCEDRSLTRLVAGPEGADVALIASRRLWEMLQTFAMESPNAAGVLASFKERVVPQRVDMLHTTYFPTSILLQRSWMWPYLSGSDRVKLARSMDVQVLGIGDVLYEEGDYNHFIYFVRRGSLTVLVKGEPLALVEPGAAFGEISVLFGDRRNSSVVAATVCELYTLHRKEIFHRLKKYPELAQKLFSRAFELRRMWMSTGRLRDIFGLVSLLSGVPFLTHTTDSMREEIAKTAEIVVVPAGFTVVHRNEPCTTLHVIGRGTVRVGGVIDPRDPFRCLPGKGEARGAGDFLGELCLQPHLWPLDTIAETSVDMWVLDRTKIREILARNTADLQALDVCVQGIQLYKAQKGKDSITEGFAPPGSSKKAAKAKAEAEAEETAPDLMTPTTAESYKRLETYDWPQYGETFSTRNAEAAKRGSLNSALLPAASNGRELLPVDKDVEKAMKKKVQELISYPVDTIPNAADADFPGPVNELQGIIVEQLLLTPTEDQPRFLRQVNSSNVKLITDTDADGGGGGGGEGQGQGGSSQGASERPSTVTMASAGRGAAEASDPVSPVGLAEEEDLGEVVVVSALEEFNPDATVKYTSQPDNLTPVAEEHSGGGVMDWSQTFGRPAKSAAEASHSQLPSPQQQPFVRRGSVSRQQLVRPGSAQLGLSGVLPGMGGSAPDAAPLVGSAAYPRRASLRRPSSGMAVAGNVYALNELGLVSPRAGSALRPVSNAADGAPTATRAARPASVDYSSQRRVSTAAERSSSALDRFVKIEDQDYFNSFVKMMPLQQEEAWIPPEEMENASAGPVAGTGPLLLLLMHVAGCQHLPEEVMAKCTKPFVKVMVGKRVLIRTPVMAQLENPSWAMNESSFISFIRRGAELQLSVCYFNEEEKEEEDVLTCSLPTTEFKESNGVGKNSLKLHNAEADAPSPSPSARAHEPRVNITMLAVMASRYKVLQKQLDNKAEEEEERRKSRAKDNTRLYLQVVGVAGLEHRIEASVKISITAEDGGETVVVETPRTEHKTRTPSWRGDAAFAKVESEGCRLKIALRHKDSVVGVCETTSDDLLFNGTSVQRFPVALPQSPTEVIGEVLVNVLLSHISSEDEGAAQSHGALVTVNAFTVERGESYDLSPDPFVVVRDSQHQAVLRTPLCFGTTRATWDAAEASCFLACPTLADSTDSYILEVFDSDESSRIGRAQLAVGHRGLKPSGVLYDIPLVPRDKGTVRLTCASLPIRELPRAKAFEKVQSARHLSRDAPMLLIHVCGAQNLLPGSDDTLLRVDPMATVTIGGQRYIKTPKHEGHADPHWPIATSSALLRLRPQFVDEVADLRVFDGIDDEADLIGAAQVPLMALCCTGDHKLTLSAAEREVGTLHVRTFCGRPSQMVLGAGEVVFADEDEAPSGAAAGSAVKPLAETHPGLLSETTTLSLTNLCNVCPKAAYREITIAIKDEAGNTILSVDDAPAETPNAIWQGGAAAALLDLRQLYKKTLRVTVTAVEAESADEVDNGTTVEVGCADIPFDMYSTVRPNEVDVKAVELAPVGKASKKSSSKPKEPAILSFAIFGGEPKY